MDGMKPFGDILNIRDGRGEAQHIHVVGRNISDSSQTLPRFVVHIMDRQR